MRDEHQLRAAMDEEAQRIEVWARLWDSTYRRHASRWSAINLVLILAAAVLAAASATTGLTKSLGALGVGLLALAAAASSGVATSLGASTKATQFNTSAASNSGLADAARVFHATTVFDWPIADVTSEFQKICDRRDTTVNNAPVCHPPWRRRETPVNVWPKGVDPPKHSETSAPR